MWRGESSRGKIGLFAAISLALASCVAAPASDTTGDGANDSSSPTTAYVGTSSTTAGGAGTTAPSPAGVTAAPCDIPSGEPFQQADSVDLTVIGETDGVVVKGAVYPHPDYEGRPWSQWGQGLVTADGRFFSAIGDHQSVDGNSFIYEYDPGTDRLTLVGDILSYVDHVSGTWGYGKVHAQMVPGPCGEIYFSTYWGSFRDIEFEGNYTGDILFRLDPFGRTLQPLGTLVEFHGSPSMASAPERSIIYAESADPVFKDADGGNRGPFVAYDVTAGAVVYQSPDEPHVGFRSILVDANGIAYYSIGDGQLQTFDPATGESTTHDSRLPGDWLRAASVPGPDGSVYGVTRDPDRLFVMNPDGSIEALGDALGYTASVALSPDGSVFYYMPGAHGNSADWGSPVVAVDTETGDQSVVIELNEMVEDRLGYTVGGTYNIAVSPDGDTIFIGANVGEASSDESFGEVLLLVVELP